MTRGSGVPGATCCFHGHIHLWRISHLCLVWALPAKRWATQRQSVLPRARCQVLSGDSALWVDTLLCGRRPSCGMGLIFAHMNHENFGKCSKLSEPQLLICAARVTVAACRVTVRMKSIPQVLYPSHSCCSINGFLFFWIREPAGCPVCGKLLQSSCHQVCAY